MALMIPDYTSEFTTEGERRFYEFLAAAAKPDNRFTGWYLPDLEGREPDFILYCDGIGLIIFEIKDWSLSQIEEADSHTFLLQAGGELRRLKSPLYQGRQYLHSLMGRIKKDGRLVSKDPRSYGNPKIPIDCGVVFPNIKKDAYREKNLDKVIDPNRVFFADDLHPASDFCNDPTGRCFEKKLAEMFPPRFRFEITRAEYNHLKQLLFPIIRVQHTQRDACVYVDPSQRTNVLDDRQEAVARRISPEPDIIAGASGSGKTLVLVHRAAFLKQRKPEAKILFLCFNVTLVNYIKRLLSEKGVGLGPKGVQVYHFFEFCSRILGEEIHYEEEGGEYYELVIEETLSMLREHPVKYDAVLIDESQDFTIGMMRVVSGVLDPEKPFLSMALDEGQNLYGGDVLEQVNRIFGGVRVDQLGAAYRNTSEIRSLAASYAGIEAPPAPICDLSGPKPEFQKVTGIGEAADYVSDTVRKLIDQREYPPSEIAVLYARRLSEETNSSIPRLLVERLESRGLVCNWVSEDYRSKRSFDITGESISISTIHSAKGLDWSCVFLLGLDELEEDGWSAAQIRSITYVAITRARHRLLIPYKRKNEVIENLLDCLR